MDGRVAAELRDGATAPRWRGRVALGLGTASLVLGLAAALVLGLFFQWLLPDGISFFLVAFPLALVTLLVGLGLRAGGARMHAAEVRAARAARIAVLVALAERQRGGITVTDAAQALGVSTAEADALLTSLAAEASDAWSLDIDPSGTLVYGLRRLQVRVDAGEPLTGEDGEEEAPPAQDAARARG